MALCQYILPLGIRTVADDMFLESTHRFEVVEGPRGGRHQHVAVTQLQGKGGDGCWTRAVANA